MSSNAIAIEIKILLTLFRFSPWWERL